MNVIDRRVKFPERSGAVLLFLTGMCEYEIKGNGPMTQVNEMNETFPIQNGHLISHASPYGVFNTATPSCMGVTVMFTGNMSV